MKGLDVEMLSRFALLLLLPAFLLASSARAQVSYSSHRPAVLYGYATATAVQPELSVGHALGGSGGIVLAHSPFMAIDFRGVMVQGRVPLHTYIVEAGPRIERRVGRRYEPFAEILGGLGHSEYKVTGQNYLSKGMGLAWTIDGGLDLHLERHLEWRVAEFSYSYIYAGSGVSPTMLNTGVIARF